MNIAIQPEALIGVLVTATVSGAGSAIGQYLVNKRLLSAIEAIKKNGKEASHDNGN